MSDMTDRELLELAAKVAKYEVAFDYYGTDRHGIYLPDTNRFPTLWNPLASDGDALRLAVKLGICVGSQTAEVWRDGKEIRHIFEDDDNYERATRRAIVLAAAHIALHMGGEL